MNDSAKTCKGEGRPGKIDASTGFYSCPVCGTIVGVALAPIHRVPAHAPVGQGMVEIPAEEQRYRLKPEHQSEPVCVAAHHSGFSQEWTIDLLLRGISLLRRKVADLESKQGPAPRIVLTGIDKPS